VRRDVWEQLDGLDPALPVFRDDLDLGWRVNAAGHRVVIVPAAQVLHARAATTGRRTTGAAPGRPAGVDRRHALFVLLAHVPALRLPLAVLRLVLACVLRTVGFLLTRQVLAARDELAALGGVLLRPRRLRRARKARRRTRLVPARSLRSLFASGTGRARARTEALAGWIAGGGARGNDPCARSATPARRAPTSWATSRPGAAAAAPPAGAPGRAAVPEPHPAGAGRRALAAGRRGRPCSPAGGCCPRRTGRATCGRRTPTSWHARRSAATRSRHRHRRARLLSTLLLGKAWLAVDVLLLASVPIAGAVRTSSPAGVVPGSRCGCGSPATWALLPVATEPVAAGRLDAAAVQIGLPPLLLAGGRLSPATLRTPAGATPGPSAWASGSWSPSPRRCGRAAVLLLGGGLWSLRARRERQVGAGCWPRAIAAAVPVLVLFPWSLEALRSPGVLHGPRPPGRRPRARRAGPAGWQLLLLSPGRRGPARDRS
jgi:hypothetical protein